MFLDSYEICWGKIRATNLPPRLLTTNRCFLVRILMAMKFVDKKMTGKMINEQVEMKLDYGM